MRISDWSSDWCSSDLLGPVCEMTGNGGVNEEPRLIAAMLVRAEQRIARHRSRPRRDHQPGQMDEGTATFDQRDRIRVDGLDAVELGSAACRERVCQYV